MMKKYQKKGKHLWKLKAMEQQHFNDNWSH